VLMGTVVAALTMMMLLLYALDNPFHAGFGGLRPVAMERALQIIDQELDVAGLDLSFACDAAGNRI